MLVYPRVLQSSTYLLISSHIYSCLADMVTGVETAGLILAVIPLLISACEHYKETKSAISRFTRKRAYLQRLILALAEQKVVLENEIEYCLRLAGLEDVASTGTIETYSTLLTEQAVTDNLKEELGRGYEAYIRALDRNRQAVIDIAKSIKGLTKDVNVCTSCTIPSQ